MVSKIFSLVADILLESLYHSAMSLCRGSSRIEATICARFSVSFSASRRPIASTEGMVAEMTSRVMPSERGPSDNGSRN